MEYEVQEIVNHRVNPYTLKNEYLIKWVGYPQNKSTWEPQSHFDKMREWVEDYHYRKNIKKTLLNSNNKIKDLQIHSLQNKMALTTKKGKIDEVIAYQDAQTGLILYKIKCFSKQQVVVQGSIEARRYKRQILQFWENGIREKHLNKKKST